MTSSPQPGIAWWLDDDPDRVGQAFENLGKLPWSRVQLDGWPPMWVMFGRTDAGRLVITGLVVEPGEPRRELSARAMRDLPLTALLERYAIGVRGQDAEAAEPYTLPALKPGPKGWPREHFEAVARAYAAAQVAHPRAPVKAVASQLQRSEPTIHRWLQRCRDLGLLGPPEPG